MRDELKKEYSLQLKFLLRVLCACVFAFLYALGGIEHKWIRRFIGPAWLGLSMFTFSRDWRVLLQVPLLMFSLSVGYGADTFWGKVFRRSVFSLANSTTMLAQVFAGNLKKRNFWILAAINSISCLVTIVSLGIFNPIPARGEELLIGLTIGLWPIFSAENAQK